MMGNLKMGNIMDSAFTKHRKSNIADSGSMECHTDTEHIKTLTVDLRANGKLESSLMNDD